MAYQVRHLSEDRFEVWTTETKPRFCARFYDEYMANLYIEGRLP